MAHFTQIWENSHLYSNPLLFIQCCAVIGIRLNSYTQLCSSCSSGFLKARASIWTCLGCSLGWDTLWYCKCVKSFTDLLMSSYTLRRDGQRAHEHATSFAFMLNSLISEISFMTCLESCFMLCDFERCPEALWLGISGRSLVNPTCPVFSVFPFLL